MRGQCRVERSHFLRREFIPTDDGILQIRAFARICGERPGSWCHVTAGLCIDLATERIVQADEAWWRRCTTSRTASNGVRQYIKFRIHGDGRRGDVSRRGRTGRF